MKIKKLKRTRKALLYFQAVHGIRPPYTVLVDGTFIQASIVHHLSLKDELEKLLNAKVIVSVTDAIVAELRALGEPFAPAAIIARRLQHISLPSTPSRVIADAIVHAVEGGNPQKLCIATEDESLKSRLRRLHCVPILRIARGTIAIDRPSDAPAVAPAPVPARPKSPVRRVEAIAGEAASVIGASAPRVLPKHKRSASPNPLSCRPRKVRKPSPSAAPPPEPSPSAPQANTPKARARKRRHGRAQKDSTPG